MLFYKFVVKVLRPLGALVVLACAIGASPGYAAEAGVSPGKEVETGEKVALPAGVLPAELTSTYIIGPGDTIQVFVWRNPELTVVVPVRPDGKVSAPLVEDMVAVGKTPVQLARDIEQRLSEYIRTPQVSIIVTNAISTFSQVKVIGQVRNPQALAFREGMTVLDVVLAVGGLTEFASGNRARIIRKDSAGKEISVNVRIEDLVVKGKVSENKSVRPGDVIIVPEALF